MARELLVSTLIYLFTGSQHFPYLFIYFYLGKVYVDWVSENNHD